MMNSSEAYDLELFQTREPHLVALKNNKKTAADKQRRTRRQTALNVIVYLTLALLAVAMIGYFITCHVRLTEMNRVISDNQAQLNVLQSERVRLEAELSGKTSAEQVNRYAQENGMATVEGNQIYYITGQEEDLVTLPGENQDWLHRAIAAVRDFFS